MTNRCGLDGCQVDANMSCPRCRQGWCVPHFNVHECRAPVPYDSDRVAVPAAQTISISRCRGTGPMPSLAQSKEYRRVRDDTSSYSDSDVVLVLDSERSPGCCCCQCSPHQSRADWVDNQLEEHMPPNLPPLPLKNCAMVLVWLPNKTHNSTTGHVAIQLFDANGRRLDQGYISIWPKHNSRWQMWRGCCTCCCTSLCNWMVAARTRSRANQASATDPLLAADPFPYADFHAGYIDDSRVSGDPTSIFLVGEVGTQKMLKTFLTNKPSYHWETNGAGWCRASAQTNCSGLALIMLGNSGIFTRHGESFSPCMCGNGRDGNQGDSDYLTVCCDRTYPKGVYQMMISWYTLKGIAAHGCGFRGTVRLFIQIAAILGSIAGLAWLGFEASTGSAPDGFSAWMAGLLLVFVLAWATCIASTPTDVQILLRSTFMKDVIQGAVELNPYDWRRKQALWTLQNGDDNNNNV